MPIPESSESSESSESNSGTVPTAIKRFNRLAVASFVLALAAVLAALVELGLLNAVADVGPPYGPTNPAPDYTIPSILGWGGLAVCVLASALAGNALDLAKRHPLAKYRKGVAQGGLLLAILAALVVICGSSWYGLLHALEGIH